MTIITPKPTQFIFPVVAIREGMVFPGAENVLIFGRPASVAAVNEAFATDQKIILVLQKDPSQDILVASDLHRVGILASIKKVLTGDKGEITALLSGEMRVKVISYTQDSPYIEAHVEELPETEVDDDQTQALVGHIHSELKRAINLGKGVDIVFLMNIMSTGNTPKFFSEHVAMILDLKADQRQKLIEEVDLQKRLQLEAEFVTKELKTLELEHNITRKTQRKFEKGMKDAVLREKLKTIEQELGTEGGNPEEKEIDELRKKIKKAKMPEEAHKKATKELSRLEKMSPYNPEASYVRTYIEWLIDMPWSVLSGSNLDLKKAQAILDGDHYGLKKVKERIIEYLAVMKLKQSNKSKKDAKQPTILCFAGPPGVGKTSLGKSIAKALGRKFVKVSLGGIRDEAEIRGHRRTYVGALPGRMIQAIKQAGTRNPVFMLDEIDKIGADYRGDPSAALLEALDPEQNHAFADHYIEVPFDLSDVMFITTANMLDTIPAALRDRLEIINFSGYIEDEKFAIARQYLIAKQLEAHGLKSKKVEITDSGLRAIVHKYTREAGVRELERQIATIFRKIARKVVETNLKSIKVDEKDLAEYLGQRKYASSLIDDENNIGISNGLAWTPVGGDMLFIEVVIMPGKGRLTLTGHLGDVMKESCQAALSYIRARHELFGLDTSFFEKVDVHVHVPEGAVAKDGPSAGLAIATAMISAFTKIPVNREVAMTGEITLRGRALEIGGLKEKVIAAHRAGIKTVLVPEDNQKDLDDIPDNVKKDVDFIFVKSIDDVLKKALVFSKKAGMFEHLRMVKN
ncbi:MAG: endopeptidase La [Candidatus Roizmanbacteria bacterium]